MRIIIGRQLWLRRSLDLEQSVCRCGWGTKECLTPGWLCVPQDEASIAESMLTLYREWQKAVRNVRSMYRAWCQAHWTLSMV